MTIYSMRLSAIAIAVLFAIALRDELTWQSAVMSIGFGHYLLSIWYARARLSGLGREWRTATVALATIITGSMLYLTTFPLFVYFAAHHVFNEVYITADHSRRLPQIRRRQLRTMAIVLHTLLYFTLLRGDLANVFARHSYLASVADFEIVTRYLVVTLSMAYVGYFVMLLRQRDALDTRSLLELSVFEIAGLVLLAVSFATPIRFLDVVCYHFVFWWFYPANKLAQRGRGAVYQYAALMAAFVGGSFLFSPAVVPDYPLRDSIYLKQFLLWSHIHITSSFFLSNAHPEWIRKWFTLSASSMRGGTLRQ
jgi:hypothetical protein